MGKMIVRWFAMRILGVPPCRVLLLYHTRNRLRFCHVSKWWATDADIRNFRTKVLRNYCETFGLSPSDLDITSSTEVGL